MAWVAIGTAVVGAVGSAVTTNMKNKAAEAAKAKPLDIDKLITDARTSAAENYKNSMDLEAQYNPAQATLRATTNLALQNLASGNTAGARARDSLLSSVTGEPNSLLSQSADSILKNLNLGGTLSAETQNAVTRGALQNGGAAGLSGSAAARGLVARDLGITSLNLLQQRQQAALQAGTVMSQDALARLNGAQTASNSDTARTGLLAGIVDARALPESGLSPGAIASATIGDHNVMNQSNANYQTTLGQNNAAMVNSLLGFGSTALSAYMGKGTGTGSGTGNLGGTGGSGFTGSNPWG